MIKSLEVEKIKKLAPELGKQTGRVREAEKETYDRIRALQNERKELLKQPITRDDYATLVCADIDRIANRYRDRLVKGMRDRMEPTARPGEPATVECAISFAERDSGSLYGGMRNAGGHWDFDQEPLSQAAATFLCREEMKMAAMDAAAAIDPWPFPDAKPMEESIKRIGAIDAELEALEQQLEELCEVMRSIRIEPSPRPVEPTPPRKEGREYGGSFLR